MPWFPLDQYIWDFWFVPTGEDLHLFDLQASREACGHHPERRHDCATNDFMPLLIRDPPMRGDGGGWLE
ncbi:hypothetical protein VB712_18170 [Spirulina sp. CCNP1310]|uniref:hypothetical protein n=1 Tax=Spirulina sp. CCNP1310 TaxID=3110249 RepID=UPI002B21D6BA|nr:hypothetical protein [Spirulina sp. CCNP1310]MEA5421156.1 hypothetical protein [Spirulina sp. CCNP1310]